MAALYLVPVDEESYQATLATPVDLSEWADRPHTFPVQARVWGVRTDSEQGSWERNRRTWEQMEPGEPLLFYRNGAGRYFATGQIGTMAQTEFVRDQFWNGGPAVSVYEVQKYQQPIGVEADRVHDVLGYAEGFVPQGTHRVSEDRPIERLLGLLERK